MKRLITRGLIAAVLSMVFSLGIAIVTYDRPPTVEAATPMGDYWGHQVYCNYKPTAVRRRSGTLKSYCTDAFYVYTSRSTGKCVKYRANGDAWLRTWGMQFKVTSIMPLGSCRAAT